MLDVASYLLGVAWLAALLAFALLGATTLRKLLLPRWAGPPAWLATTILSICLLLWVAELLGTFELFKQAPYLLGMAITGLGLRFGLRVAARNGKYAAAGEEGFGGSPRPADTQRRRTPGASSLEGDPSRRRVGRGVPPNPSTATTVVCIAIALLVVIDFASGARLRLSTGMTGFDTTWYHAPFAAGFFQSGDTFDLHFIAPQFLAWFYPANSEVLHAVGMLGFDRDILSPLLNLGWLVGALLAAWCIGRPFGVAPLSLAAAAIALDVGAFADQAGEARNDIVGTFFLLAAVAIALNAHPLWPREGGRFRRWGPALVAGLALGFAAGTKLNFLLPAAVLVFGLTWLAPHAARLRALAVVGLPALAAGGYWYLRNLVHTGNPLPWITDLGLPGPDQALGGREGHSVLGYVTDEDVWAGWLIPGLHSGLGDLSPALLLFAALGLALCLGKRSEGVLRVAAAAGVAVVAAWAIAPTSASGPEGSPEGFESGLRYLVPALVLGLALLPAAPLLRHGIRRLVSLGPGREWSPPPARLLGSLGVAALAVAVAGGYAVQRHYLENRYADPGFTAPGLNAAFEWARGISDSRIATTSTRQYPFFGTDLSNRVSYVGRRRPHGGFAPIPGCRAWITALNEGDYDYVVASKDRTAAGKDKFPPSATWTQQAGARLIFRAPPTAVFRLTRTLSPARCEPATKSR